MNFLQAKEHYNKKLKKYSFFVKVFLLSALFLWITGIFTPVLYPDFRFHNFLDVIYSFTCHQNPLKTINIDGNSVLVCSRCLGIYSGLFFAGLISLMNYYINNYKLFVISCIILISEVILYNTGFYEYSKIIAFLTGFLLGSTGFFLILQGIEDTLKEMIKD